MKNKVNILGTEWTIDASKPLNGADGTCDKTTKTVRLCKHTFDDDTRGFDNTVQDLDSYKRTVIRHELIHALGFMCGLGECSFLKNEECVDWIAKMYPVMKKIFKELEIEE